MISVGDFLLCKSPFTMNYWMNLEMRLPVQWEKKKSGYIIITLSVLEINEV